MTNASQIGPTGPHPAGLGIQRWPCCATLGGEKAILTVSCWSLVEAVNRVVWWVPDRQVFDAGWGQDGISFLIPGDNMLFLRSGKT